MTNIWILAESDYFKGRGEGLHRVERCRREIDAVWITVQPFFSTAAEVQYISMHSVTRELRSVRLEPLFTRSTVMCVHMAGIKPQ